MTNLILSQRERGRADRYVDMKLGIELIRNYNLLSLVLKEKFLYKNLFEIMDFCSFAPWDILEKNIMFFLHVVSIRRCYKLFPRRIREYSRVFIINQILIYIENQFTTMLLVKKLPISHYLLSLIFKFGEINLQIPSFIIDVMRSPKFKEYKSYVCRGECRGTPLQLKFQAFRARIDNPKIKTYDKYKELFDVLITFNAACTRQKNKKVIQIWIDQRTNSLFNRINS